MCVCATCLWLQSISIVPQWHNPPLPPPPIPLNSADFLFLSDKRLITAALNYVHVIVVKGRIRIIICYFHRCPNLASWAGEGRNNYGDIDWVIHMHSVYVLLSIAV